MTTRDYQLVQRAIENCENREKQTCSEYIRLNPQNRERIEANRDMFLFAAMMIKYEIDRMLQDDKRRLNAWA